MILYKIKCECKSKQILTPYEVVLHYFANILVYLFIDKIQRLCHDTYKG